MQRQLCRSRLRGSDCPFLCRDGPRPPCPCGETPIVCAICCGARLHKEGWVGGGWRGQKQSADVQCLYNNIRGSRHRGCQGAEDLQTALALAGTHQASEGARPWTRQ